MGRQLHCATRYVVDVFRFFFPGEAGQQRVRNRLFCFPLLPWFYAFLREGRTGSKSRHPFLPGGLLLGGEPIKALDVGDLAVRMKREFNGLFALAGSSWVTWVLCVIRRRLSVRSCGVGGGSVRLDDSRAETRHCPAGIGTQIFDLDKQKKILIGLAASRCHGRGDRAFCIRVGLRAIANLISDDLADGEFGEEYDAVHTIASRARNRHEEQAAGEESYKFIHGRRRCRASLPRRFEMFVEELNGCVIGGEPRPMQEEVMNFVGKN